MQLVQQLYQGSGHAEAHNLELQQKVLTLHDTISQMTLQMSTAQHSAQQPAQHEAQHAQHDAQLAAEVQLREAQLEQEFKEELSVMESDKAQQLLELKAQHDVELDELHKQNEELEASTQKKEQEHQQQLDTLKDDQADQLLDLKAEHANLMDQLTKQKDKVEILLKDAHAASKEAADKHDASVRQLTDQVEQLEVSLKKACSQSTADQHQPELLLLRQQKQKLEEDLKEARSANVLVENKLEETDLQLADAEDKLSEAEQKLKQAEKQASKAAKTIRVYPHTQTDNSCIWHFVQCCSGSNCMHHSSAHQSGLCVHARVIRTTMHASDGTGKVSVQDFLPMLLHTLQTCFTGTTAKPTDLLPRHRCIT